jgi:hypothetical protein
MNWGPGVGLTPAVSVTCTGDVVTGVFVSRGFSGVVFQTSWGMVVVRGGGVGVPGGRKE